MAETQVIPPLSSIISPHFIHGISKEPGFLKQRKTTEIDKVVAGRWKVVEKLGEGGMGAVYRVEDKNRKNFFAAMKVEDDLWEGGVLKLEVFILQQLQKLRDTVKLYDSGKRDKYCFMVMTLCGKDLMTLKRLADRPFSESTTLRLAVSTLYAIKQVHEIGYVHRDVKPGNCMIGKYGRDTRMIYLIDFGSFPLL
ncbi:hypothetical protein ANCCAN_05614 [Ancylostoma caninum]|uniref:non-specific serine/threonine protein kinase n=1 Tax=Ancylostoma caninum TaxID=29170 RepID=A0A368GZ80_ANCCA|nr:hypothetical protein ANCCAN_05614 [Ancylostoma caninum]